MGQGRGRHGGALATAAVAVLATIAAIVPACVQAAAEAAPVPAIEFVDQAPLTRTGEELRQDGGLRVTLQNNTGDDCMVRLRIVALQPQTGARIDVTKQLFGTESVQRERAATEVKLRDVAEGELPLTPAAKAEIGLAPGTYAGVIVAGSDCGIARLPLTISVAEPTTAPGRGQLDAGGVQDLTLTATNFLPSILSPAGPTLMVIAWILLVLAAIRWWIWVGASSPVLKLATLAAAVTLAVLGVVLETFGEPISGPLFVTLAVLTTIVGGLCWRGSRHDEKALAVVIVAACVAGAVFGGHFGSELADQPGVRLVAPKPVAVDATAGRVGIVVDERGNVADLEVEDGMLQPEGLMGAGVYSGGYDLNGAVADGSAKATVKVSDWWLWAFLTIAGGVLVGYVIRRWFARDRPRAVLRLRSGSLWQRAADMKPTDAIPANWLPTQRLETRLARAEERIRLGEDDTATTTLDDAEKYLDRVLSLHNGLHELHTLATQLEGHRVLQGIGLAREQVPNLKAWDALRRREFDSADLDSDSTRLKLAEDDVAALAKQMRATQGAFVRMLEAREIVRRRLPEKAAVVRKQRDARLLELGKAILEAADEEKVAESSTQIEQELAKLPAADAGEQPRPRLRRILQPSTLQGIIEVGPADVSPFEHATIEAMVLGPVEGAETSGNVDDVFRVRARLPSAGAAPVQVRWRVDLGESIPQTIPADGEPPWLQFRLPVAGEHTVLLENADGAALATQPFTVTGPSRVASDRELFAARDRVWTLAVGAFAVASGLAALYLADPAWGTSQDYVAAALWGGTVAEGSTFVATLVSRSVKAG